MFITLLKKLLMKAITIQIFNFILWLLMVLKDVVIEKNGCKSITFLKITSEQFKDNDESTITKKQDMWTFQKNIKSKSPIWLLVFNIN